MISGKLLEPVEELLENLSVFKGSRKAMIMLVKSPPIWILTYLERDASELEKADSNKPTARWYSELVMSW